MSKKPDIQRLIELQQLMLQFHTIERRTRHPKNFNKFETDTEHSYTLAMATWMLSQHFPKLDKNKIIQLALVHDLLEIHAGDTFIFADSKTIADKVKRETAAVERLAEDWQDFPEMLDSIHEYEARQTAEAKFVYALDKLMPIILNYLNQGRTWRHENISLETLITTKDPKISVSPEIYEYYKEIVAILQKHPGYFSSSQQR